MPNSTYKRERTKHGSGEELFNGLEGIPPARLAAAVVSK